MIEYSLYAIMASVIALLMIFRTNVAVCFLALTAGYVLLGTSGTNAGLVAASLTSGWDFSTVIARLVLLFTPLAVCAVMLRGQLSKGLMPLGLIVAVCLAVLAVDLAVPLLPVGTRLSISDTQTWALMEQYREMYTGIGLVVSIILISMTVKRPHGKHKRGH